MEDEIEKTPQRPITAHPDKTLGRVIALEVVVRALIDLHASRQELRGAIREQLVRYQTAGLFLCHSDDVLEGIETAIRHLLGDPHQPSDP